MPKLTAEIAREPNSEMLTLTGILDLTTLPQVEPYLAGLANRAVEGIRLNLYECEYIDPAGLRRLLQFGVDLQKSVRPLTVYVRPMSFVAFRTRPLPQASPVPPSIAKAGEERMAERRLARLERWRREKPILDPYPPGVPRPSGEIPAAVPSAEAGEGTGDVIPIDFRKVSILAEKDERVVQRIWETYSEFLDSGRLKQAEDGLADTQLTLDARFVAKHLRLDPKEVRKVIESVSTYLTEVFGEE
jgi:ABC-type transporter Mla MlaB component